MFGRNSGKLKVMYFPKRQDVSSVSFLSTLMLVTRFELTINISFFSLFLKMFQKIKRCHGETRWAKQQSKEEKKEK